MSLSTRRFRSRTGRSTTCPERIAEVRQLYLDTLKDWPDGQGVRCTPAVQEGAREEGARQEGAGQEGAGRRRRPPRRRRQEDAGQEDAGQEGSSRSTTVRGRTMTASRSPRRLQHHRRRAGARLGVVEGRARAAQRLAARPAPRAPRHQGRGAATARRGPAGRGGGPARRGARSRRGPVGGSGAGVLGARRTAHPGQGRRPDLRPRHLPSAGDPAAPHPSQGSVPRPHRRRRAGQGVRAASAVAGQHRRRQPPRLRALRAAPRQRWPSSGSNCACSDRNTSRRN